MSDLVIVTGASSGIGLELARNVPFAAHVVDISRSGPPPGDDIEHFAADLSSPAEWEGVGRFLSGLVEDHDPSRAVLVHAAGTLDPIGFAGEVGSAAYASNVVLNSAAGQVVGHHYLAALAGREGSFDLVMITSGAASSVYPGWSAYGAGKAALDHWVRHAGAEQKERGGIRVSAIAPGVVATGMQRLIRDTSERDFPAVGRFRQLHEQGKLADAADAASRIWEVIESGLESGSVIDVRGR
jgi:benzil reductase ((S)-benzoin forming)